MTRVKFCGITRLEDAELAVELDAWAVGLILWPGSVRRCSHDDAAVIAAALKRRVEVVGVFVNAHLDHVIHSSDALGLSIVQLHGDEGPSYCAEVARRTGCRVMKAVRVHSGADLQAVRAFHVDFHLLDTGRPGSFGGTGETWDWRILSELRGERPIVVSGGLNPENVEAAVAATSPWAVDVASGVEASPGIKDPEKMRAFADAIPEPVRLSTA